MGRTHVRQRRLAATLAVALIGSAWAVPAMRALGAGVTPAAASGERYVVRQGDTLWSIAESLVPGQDPRPVVDALRGANQVDPGRLVPGEALLMPEGV